MSPWRLSLYASLNTALRACIPGFLLAVEIPPQSRINHRCYPEWNSMKEDLQLVWDGKIFPQPFNESTSFRQSPTAVLDRCSANNCTLRLWCTDSGVAGWYSAQSQDGKRHNDNCTLHATWLLNSDMYYKHLLVANGSDDPGGIMTSTNRFGPGTLAVLGNTVYFYTYIIAEYSVYGLPRLTSLIFSEYRQGAMAGDLVTEGLRAFNILGYQGKFRWVCAASPIYPNEANSVTVSVQDFFQDSQQAIDAVVNSPGWRGPLVHSQLVDTPSLFSATREILTTPQYACRAYIDGSTRCCPVTPGRHTWAVEQQEALGWVFQPLQFCFNLPVRVWLQAEYHTGHRGSAPFAALVGFGMPPIMIIENNNIYAVVKQASEHCTGDHLEFVHLGLGEKPTIVSRSDPLGCVPSLSIPNATFYEPSYASTAIKWARLYNGSPMFFLAEDLDMGKYSGPWPCEPGQYPLDLRCEICPEGFFCDGLTRRPCRANTYSSAGQPHCTACPLIRVCRDGLLGHVRGWLISMYVLGPLFAVAGIVSAVFFSLRHRQAQYYAI